MFSTGGRDLTRRAGAYEIREVRPPRGGRSAALGRSGLALAGLFLVVGVAWGGAPRSAEAGLAAALSGAEDAGEHWDLTARFESGHALFVRFAITNQGPGARTAFATGHVVFPDGSHHSWQHGRREGRWSASPDGLFLKVAASELDLRGGERSFRVDSDKQRANVTLRFAATPASESSTTRTPVVSATPLAHAEGTLQVGPMQAPLPVRGVAFLRHSRSEAAEAEVSLRWLDLLGGEPERGLALWALEAPDGSWRQWLALRRPGQPLLETSEFSLGLEGARGPESAYPVPASLRIEGSGVSGSVALGAELLRTDPLQIIPQPFRWFLSQQIAPRRIWSDATLRIRAPGDAIPLELPALVVVSWTRGA